MSIEKHRFETLRPFLSKLAKIDLGAISHVLEHKKGWSYQKTVRAILGYLAFLLLVYLYPDQKLVPSVEVDTVWHHHILDTLKYTEDCETLFGYYVHHFPYLGERGEADQQELQQSFADTKQLLVKFLGTVSEDVLAQGENARTCPPQSSGCCLRKDAVKLVRPGNSLTLEALMPNSSIS